MKEYQERVITEQKELSEKADKLNNFTATDQFKQLDDLNQSLMLEQLEIMSNYNRVLNARIGLFN